MDQRANLVVFFVGQQTFITFNQPEFVTAPQIAVGARSISPKVLANRLLLLKSEKIGVRT